MRPSSARTARATWPQPRPHRAHARLDAIDADTSVLAELVDGLAVRTA